LPNIIADFIVELSNEKVGTVSFIALLISALIISSNGTYSMIKASNTVYGVKDSRMLINRIKSLIMVLILILTFVVIFALPVFGDYIVSIFEQIKISGFPAIKIISTLKYPITFVLIYLFIKILYTIAPNVKIGLNKTSKGALFTTVMWILATLLYSLYIEKVFSYESVYGGLSSILCLLIWLSIISYIFVLGMVINASYYSVDVEEKNYIESGLNKTHKVVKKIRRR